MEKNQKTVIQIYIAYLIAMICNIIPSTLAQSFGFILFIIIFITTYVYRSKSEKNSLVHNHMKFIIKSIWMSSLFLFIGMVVSYLLADHSIIYQAVDSVRNGAIYNEDQLNIMMMNYIKKNSTIFIATLSPSLMYVFFRLIKGLTVVKNNSFITDQKNWP